MTKLIFKQTPSSLSRVTRSKGSSSLSFPVKRLAKTAKISKGTKMVKNDVMNLKTTSRERMTETSDVVAVAAADDDVQKIIRQNWFTHIRLESSRALDREVDHAIQNLFISPLDLGHNSLDLSTPVFETFQRESFDPSFETLKKLSEVAKVMDATKISFMHRLYQKCVRENKSIFLKFVTQSKENDEIFTTMFTTPLFLSKNAYERQNEYAIPIEVITIKNNEDQEMEWEDVKRLRTQFVHFMILTRGMAGGVTPTNSVIAMNKIHTAALYAPYMEALLFKNASSLTDQQFQKWIKGNQTLQNVSSETVDFTAESPLSSSFPLWDPRQASLSVFEGHSWYVEHTPYYFGDLEE